MLGDVEVSNERVIHAIGGADVPHHRDPVEGRLVLQDVQPGQQPSRQT